MIATDDPPVGVRFPDPPAADDGVAAIAHELARRLGAATVSISWQGAGAMPLPLFGRPCAAAASAAPAAPIGWTATGDGGGCLISTLPAAGGMITIDACFAEGGEQTRRSAVATAAELLPLIRPFFGCWSAEARLLRLTRALSAATDGAGAGVLLLDGRARLMFANTVARALLDRGDGLRRSGAHVGAARPTDTLRLHAAIARVVAGGSDRVPLMSIARDGRRPLIVAIGASGVARVGPEECAAIVHVVDPEHDQRALIEPACQLYGLSPVETRLACLLTEGISLTAAAAAMHVREQTARSYLKQIFLKTDTHRQAELVWLLLRSAVYPPQPNSAA